MTTQTPTAGPDPTAVLVRRLARPHPSGGMVIERSVILAEGARSATILKWIDEHDGIADSTTAQSRSHGLHSPPAAERREGGPARRFVLPADAFTVAPEQADGETETLDEPAPSN